MNLSYKAKMALLIAAQAVVVAGVALLLYVPSVRTIGDLEVELKELSDQQADYCREVETNPTPEKDIARARSEIQRLEQRLPPESRISWLSARIAEAMSRHNVDLRAASNWQAGGRTPPVPELKGLQKSLTVRCSARDLEAFLEAVNALPFVVIVEDLSVLRDRQVGFVSARLKLNTFVLRHRVQGATPAGA
jgi:Tfp pilus assembly protein PilO